jgi:FMN phosphatase YigB (HAD superfamily)
MIRAVFFDFYSVWTPDKLSYYLAVAEQNGPEVHKQLTDVVENYYHGKLSIENVADTFRVKLGHPDLSVKQFKLQESDVSPEIIDFMRNLHGHFLKIGILANLGLQEYGLLNNFNSHNQLFEVIASPLTFKTDAPLLSQEVFSQALQSIGEPLHSCLFVSGNLTYLEFATSLGIGVVQFEGFTQLKKYLDQLLASEQPQ